MAKAVKRRTAPRVKRPRPYAATDRAGAALRTLKARVRRLEDELAIVTSRLDARATPPDETP